MKLFVKDIKGLVLPKQAKKDDAGYDVIATTEGKIVGEFIERPYDGAKIYRRVTYIEYGTNLFVAPQNDVEQVIKHFTADASGALCGTQTEKEETLYHVLLHPRSSVSKYNLVLANSVGIIDHGYRNQIGVRFKYIFQPEDLVILPEANVTRVYGLVNPMSIYQQGDAICQIKASPNIPIEFELVKELDQTERGQGGFGSTGT